MGWLRKQLRARRTERASDQLGRAVEALGGRVDATGGVWVGELSLSIDDSDEGPWLCLRSAFDPGEVLRLASRLTTARDALGEDPRIVTLVRDAAAIDLAIDYDDDALTLRGMAEPLDLARLEGAVALTRKLAARLPVVAADIVGTRADIRGDDAWASLARAWSLLRHDTQHLSGLRGGFELDLRASEERTRLLVRVPTDRLALIASDRDDAGHEARMPLRGGFGPLFVWTDDDGVSEELAATRTVVSLSDRIGRPFVLRWDERGLTLEADAELSAALRTATEHLLRVAAIVAGDDRPAVNRSPYRRRGDRA